MNPFAYARAGTPDEAAATFLTHPAASYLAGGTTLLDLMKEGVERPQTVVDINSLPLRRITAAGGALQIGAMVRNSEIAVNPEVVERFAVLSQAILAGASGQIRNMASTGGNLLQRTRCSYFRDLALPCNKRQPGSGCGALNGYNRNHAVLGGSDHCIATHPSDMAVALTALDAKIHVRGSAGEKIMPLREFYRLPGSSPHLETHLAPGDLILSVEIPELPEGTRSNYRKVRDRASYEFALASAAVVVSLEGNRMARVGVALGGVGTIPWHSPAAEKALTGRTVGPAVFREAADAALEGSLPREHNGFKIELARRTLVRALREATEAHA